MSQEKMLTLSEEKGWCHRKQKIKHFGIQEEFLTRIAKSLYYVDLPLLNCTSLPVTELASEIFSEANKFSLNRLDIEKAACLSRNACVSPCLLVVALLYLERLKSSNPKYLTQVSPTELFLISLMVGSKFLQDDGEEELTNTEWADLTGLTVQEINKAEKQFLDAINWEVFVSNEDFWKRFNSLETKVGLRQGCKRGWFTYSELNLLLQLFDFATVTHCLWSVTTACLLSYTASVLALVGSALLVSHIPGLGLKPKTAVSNVADDWIDSSPYTLATNVLTPSNAIQDCNASSSLDLGIESNITEPTFFNVRKPAAFNANVETNFKDSFNSKFFSGLHLHFSPTNFFYVGHLIVDSKKEKNPGTTITEVFNVWAWSDYLRNFLVQNSIPSNFYSVASF